MNVTQKKIKKFQNTVWKHYRAHGRRSLSWRKTRDPYKILVSEIMLQQTQVARVLTFYQKFIKKFPDFCTLARAPLKSVLSTWQGMGYNRRAIALKKSAQIIVEKHGGELPKEVDLLKRLPGVGAATAGAIVAYVFNEPVTFVETNIRRVFIYHFFIHRHPDRRDAMRPEAEGSLHALRLVGMTEGRKVDDHEILKLVAQTLDRKNPREWYWALMDYGAMLGVTLKKNPNARSAQYRRQPKFEGSRRQLRGSVLKMLLKKKQVTARQMREYREVLPELEREGFIKLERGAYRLVFSSMRLLTPE